MDPLQIIALTPGIPEPALRALAETLPKKSQALNALASRPDLTEPVAAILHNKVTGRARAATVRHITDPERLRELFKKGDLRSAVCANPHTPVDLLDKVMSEASLLMNAPALRAACNPNTPLETRKSQLQTRNTAELLVSVSAPVALSVAHAYALVTNNLWMLEDSTRWGTNISRALVSRPKPPLDLLKSLQERPFALSRVPGARNHPLISGREVSAMTAAELVEARNVAAELELIARPEFNVTLAAAILEQPGIGPEPQIISACLQRFGIDALLATDVMPRWAVTRLSAASWLEPMAGHLEHLVSPGWNENKNARTLTDHHEARQQVPKLLANPNNPVDLRETLHTIYALAKDWEGSLGDLLAVGRVL